MFTLRQLRYLDALARHGHFGRAAEECSVSQPALSMQISELENELKAKLVERQQGATVLTEVGREVARRAADMLSAARDLADSARGGARPLSIKLLRFAEPQPCRTVGLAWRSTSARKADCAALGRDSMLVLHRPL